ncbi:DUF4998 domain-containing protein [Pedobacter gandavensis]|uniref:DUF4998 domain-containing protein n=1 Tax=Pedobacter gandavensis TaxID=2679963 RepID=UPI0029302E1E|nr:DUF4998 domain-containing protein [Pedobacter gandavensis]
MIKRIIYLLITIAVVFSACDKGDEYKSFIPKGEKIYPGIDTAVAHYGGNKRLLLTWPSSPDQRVSKYVVYWNNRLDSMVIKEVSHSPKDTVKALINNLSEGSYTFVINSFDNKGNRSVDVEENNAIVYGPIYNENLFNRPVNRTDYNADSKAVNIYWEVPDIGNVKTEITFTAMDGKTEMVVLKPEEEQTVISGWKAGTVIYYQSYYKPDPRAIDVFKVLLPGSIVPGGR